MKNTVYVVGSKPVFDNKFAEFSQGLGHYAQVNFKNSGAVRHSIDGTLTLLEEEQSKFMPADLALPHVTIYDEEGIRAYLRINKDNWEVEDLI